MGRKFNDLTGQRFGNLVALERLPYDNAGVGTVWRLRCDCGAIHTTTYQTLVKGHCKRCPKCRTNRRVISADPLVTIRIMATHAGVYGALAYAMDVGGNIIAASGWSSVPFKAYRPLAYKPLGILYAQLEQAGLVQPLKIGQTRGAWADANHLTVEMSLATSTQTMLDAWDRIKACGVLAHHDEGTLRMWEANRTEAMLRYQGNQILQYVPRKPPPPPGTHGMVDIEV